MRELKFRAWDRGHEQMLYDIGYCHGYVIEQQWDESWDGEHESVWRYYPELGREGTEYVIEQYTGLHDKDGREIYEGDIVNCSCGCPHTVEWRKELRGEYGGGMPGWYLSDLLSGYGKGYAWTENEEVVGNIHENPELVAGDDQKSDAP